MSTSSHSKLFRCTVTIFPCWLHLSQLQGFLLIAQVSRRGLCVGTECLLSGFFFFFPWFVSCWQMTQTSLHISTTVNVCVCLTLGLRVGIILWLCVSGYCPTTRPAVQNRAEPVPRWSLSPLTVPEATKRTRQTGLTSAHADRDRLSDNAAEIVDVFCFSGVAFCFVFSDVIWDYFCPSLCFWHNAFPSL